MQLATDGDFLIEQIAAHPLLLDELLDERLLEQPATLRAGWVCGLGHGVLQSTPEENVRLALRVQREMFA